MKKISVCVPSYNRPDTLNQLINSFIQQEYSNKELVISDDTKNDVIKDLIAEYNDKRILYFHNSPGLGFSRNLLASLERATGDYLVILGDDDMLLQPTALSSYVSIFNTHPSVSFVYSNIVQFSDSLNVESIINFSTQDTLYKKGKEAMEHMWIHSIFIGGIGLRNMKNLKKYYATKKILHPQVEFIGNIINEHDAYLLAENNIGFRSHNDQIIFRALKNKNIRQEGSHMTVELFDIFMMLKKKYSLTMNFDFAAKELVNQQMVMMFKEKSNLGKAAMQSIYKNFCHISSYAAQSRKFKIAYIFATIIPASSIMFLRGCAISLIRQRNKDTYATYKKQIALMIAPAEKRRK